MGSGIRQTKQRCETLQLLDHFRDGDDLGSIPRNGGSRDGEHQGIARQWYYARFMRLNRLKARARVLREGSSTVSRARSPLALWLAALCVGEDRGEALCTVYSHRARSGDPDVYPRAILFAP